jgi:D-lactate dehydrogenase (cytochrome)
MLIKKDRSAIESYFEDSSNLKGGYAEGVAFPEDIKELSAFLADACKRRAPVTVSGGGTATTGARIPFGGLLLSLEKMNSVIGVSKALKTATAEAGASVEELKAKSENNGLFYASHPTEKWALLGGTVATNASGARSFKYGPTRRQVRRLKMALSDGEIFEIRRGERRITKNDNRIILDSGRIIEIPVPSYRIPAVKSSAGYFACDGMDPIDLFIGQEGTLSVIVEIDFALIDLPCGILSSFVFFDTLKDAWLFASEARSISGKGQAIDALSIEYLGTDALELLRRKNRNVPANARAAIFFEQETPEKEDPLIMDAWLELIRKHNASADRTWVAMTEKEQEDFNELRHSVPESVNEIVKANGFSKLSTDIAVPEKSFDKMISFYYDTLRPEKIQNVIFGHIGECHLHVNLLPKNETELERSRDICNSFYEKGVALGGTVSAEHGIGKIRRKYLEMMYGRKSIIEMARIKKALDPACILGLDNIFQRELLKGV